MTGANTAVEEEPQQQPQPDTTASLPDRLQAVLEQEPNRVCAECPEPEPTWACLLTNPLDHKEGEGGAILMGVLCCYKCYGGHFQLGEDVCQVKSTRRADGWTEEEIQVLEYTGNQIVNEIYEYKLTPETKEQEHSQDKDAFVTDKYKSLKYFNKKKFQQHLKLRKKGAEAKHDSTKESSSTGRKTFKLPGRSRSSRDGLKGGRNALKAGVKTITAAAKIAHMPAIPTPSFDWGTFSKAAPGAKQAATDEQPENSLSASSSEHGTSATSRKSNSLNMSLLEEIAAELEDDQPDGEENDPLGGSTREQPRRSKRVTRRGVRQSKSSPQTLLAMVGGSEAVGARKSLKEDGDSDHEDDLLPDESRSRRGRQDGSRHTRRPTNTRDITGDEESESGRCLKSRSSSRRGTALKGEEEGMKDHSGRDLKKRSSRRIRESTSDDKAARRAPRNHRAPRRANSDSGDGIPAHRTPRRANSSSGDVIPARRAPRRAESEIRGKPLSKKNSGAGLASQSTEICLSPTLRDESTHSRLSLSESLSRHFTREASILNGSSLSIGSVTTDRRSWGSSSLAGSELSLSPRRRSEGSLDLSSAIDSKDAAAPRVPFLSSIDDIVVEKRPDLQCSTNDSNSLLDSCLLSCPDSPSTTASNSSSDPLSIPGGGSSCSKHKPNRSSHSKRSKGKEDPARSSKHESTPSCSHSIGSLRRKHRNSKNDLRNPTVDDEDTTIAATILALKAINSTSVVVNPSTQKLAFQRANRPSSSPNIGALISRKSGTKMTSTGRLSSDPLSISSAHNGRGQANYDWSKPQRKVNTSNIRNHLLMSAVDPLLTG